MQQAMQPSQANYPYQYQMYAVAPPPQPQQAPRQTLPPQKSSISTLMKLIYHDFQQFMFSNNVLIVATGWGIGTATKDMIERLVKDMVVPIMRWISQIGFINASYSKLQAYVATTKWEGVLTGLSNITWDFMIWIFIIFMTFVLLEYFLNRWLIGMRTTVPDEDNERFVKAKAAAKENIIPDKKDAVLLDKKIKLEEVTGEILIKKEEQKLQKVPLA